MADTAKSPVLHYWSLSVEEQFYVVWPLCCSSSPAAPLAQRAWSVVLRRIALALGVVVAGSLVMSWHQSASGSPFAYFGLHTRAWELGNGAALALGRPALRLLTRAARALAVGGLVAIVASALLMDEATPFPGTAALIPVLGTAMLVAAGARLPDEGISRALSNPVARYIGRVSYAWYLWHWPVLVIANSRFGEASTGVSADGEAAAGHAGWPVVLAAVALSFALAVASHYLVEQPMRQARPSRRRGGGRSSGCPRRSLAHRRGRALSGRGRGQDAGAQARQDTPQILEKCNNNPQTVSAPPAEECRLGPAKGKRTIALIGDSPSTGSPPCSGSPRSAAGPCTSS